jgi:hypothetical protein
MKSNFVTIFVLLKPFWPFIESHISMPSAESSHPVDDEDPRSPTHQTWLAGNSTRNFK